MTVKESIDSCLAGEAERWNEFWPLLEATALDPIRQLLKRHGLDATRAEDVVHELYLYLFDEEFFLLRGVAALGEEDARNRLRTIAVLFAQNLIRSWRTALRREARALSGYSLPRRDGPTEEVLTNALKEFKSLMSPSDCAKWQELQDADSPAEEGGEATASVRPIPARTRRGRERRLFKRYRDRFLESFDC